MCMTIPEKLGRLQKEVEIEADVRYGPQWTTLSGLCRRTNIQISEDVKVEV